ncbi:MAG: hypothetical protein ACE5KZ_02680 [Candidatus Scalinduaceae bacterium]
MILMTILGQPVKISAGSIMLIEPKRFGSGYKPEPAYENDGI